MKKFCELLDLFEPRLTVFLRFAEQFRELLYLVETCVAVGRPASLNETKYFGSFEILHFHL